MLIPEKGVLPLSTMRFCTPSALARELYFHVLCAGRFVCDGDYHLERKDYQSFLAMYVESGEGLVESLGRRYAASALSYWPASSARLAASMVSLSVSGEIFSASIRSFEAAVGSLSPPGLGRSI